MVIQHLEQIRKVQKLVKWVSQELTTNQKNCHFEVSSSLILHNSKPFLDWIGMWDKKWDFIWDHGHSLVVCCQSDPPPLSESWENHYSWEGCSPNTWNAPRTAALKTASVSRKGPTLLHSSAQLHVSQPMLQKLNKLDQDVLPHSPYSPDRSPMDYPFFKHLKNVLQGKWLPQPAGSKKRFPRGCWAPKRGFYAAGINKLISHWQKCVDCNGSCFD